MMPKERPSRDTGTLVTRRPIRIGMVASVDPQHAQEVMEEVQKLLNDNRFVAKQRVYRIVPQTLQPV